MASNPFAFPQALMRHDSGQTVASGEHCTEYGGMDLRDYFAAHAPHDPPEWFRPLMSSATPLPVFRCGGRGEHTDACGFDICGVVNAKECQAWGDEHERQRLIQWPYAWADAQLAQRQGQPVLIAAAALVKASEQLLDAIDESRFSLPAIVPHAEDTVRIAHARKRLLEAVHNAKVFV